MIVLIDSDGQHDPNDLPKMIKPLHEGKADLVIGSRFVSGGKSKDMPTYRKFGLKLINTVSKLHSKQLIRDTQSGYRAFNKKAIDSLRFENEGMKSSLEILESISDKGLRILEIPTTIRYDLKNTSSLHPIPHGISVFSYALSALSQKRPLLVFGLPGFNYDNNWRIIRIKNNQSCFRMDWCNCRSRSYICLDWCSWNSTACFWDSITICVKY